MMKKDILNIAPSSIIMIYEGNPHVGYPEEKWKEILIPDDEESYPEDSTFFLLLLLLKIPPLSHHRRVCRPGSASHEPTL